MEKLLVISHEHLLEILLNKRIDVSNASEVEENINKAINEHPNKYIILNAENLE